MSKSSLSRIYSVEFLPAEDIYFVHYMSYCNRRYPRWRVPKSVLNFCCDDNLIVSYDTFTLWQYNAYLYDEVYYV